MQYRWVWLLPVVGALAWLAMLLTLQVKWHTDGSPHYPSMEPDQRVPFISDVGAQYLRPVFIALSAVVVLALDLTVAADRWLRHKCILLPNTDWIEKLLGSAAIVFALGGGAGLILVAIFDVERHPRLHAGFLILFMGGYIVSAVLMCIEYHRLWSRFQEHRILRASFEVKMFFILVESGLGVVLVSLMMSNHHQEAAIAEWVMAYIFTFSIAAFVIDLLPAARHAESEYPGSTGSPGVGVEYAPPSDSMSSYSGTSV